MNKRNMKQGFSLIEVIVAVAILAILSMPILLYFTNAAVKSAEGRHEQAADIAAQSVVEEIDAVESFDKLEKYFVDGSNGWEFITDGDGNQSIAANSKGKTVLKKPVSIDYDGNGVKDFIARVEIDYGAYQASTDSNKTAKYNDYENPHLSEVYTDNSVIISEADQTESGIYAIYHKLNGHSAFDTNSGSSSVSLDEIKSGVKRTFEIKITVDPADSKYVYVSGGYGLKYSTQDVHIVIKNSRVLRSELSKIYFLFRFLNSESDVKIDASALSDDECKNLAISFIRQKTPVWGNPTPSPSPTPDPAEGEDDIDDGDTSGPGTDMSGESGKTAPQATPTVAPITVNLNEEIKKENLLKLTLDSANSSKNVAKISFYANDNVYFSNAVNKKNDPESESDDQGNLWMVNSPNDKRIAKVHIYIYARDKYTDESTSGFLAETTTSKSI